MEILKCAFSLKLNPRWLNRIQQTKLQNNIRDLARNWTQVACLQVRHLNHHTRMFSVLLSEIIGNLFILKKKLDWVTFKWKSAIPLDQTSRKCKKKTAIQGVSPLNPHPGSTRPSLNFCTTKQSLVCIKWRDAHIYFFRKILNGETCVGVVWKKRRVSFNFVRSICSTVNENESNRFVFIYCSGRI